MRAVTLDHVRKNLDEVVRRVTDDAEAAIVLTESGEQVVLMPLNHFNAWSETHYLLSTPANAAHLRKSIAQIKAGKLIEKDLIEDSTNGWPTKRRRAGDSLG